MGQYPIPHPNPRENRLTWAVHLPQNGIPLVLTHGRFIVSSPGRQNKLTYAEPLLGYLGIFAEQVFLFRAGGHGHEPSF